MKAKVLLVEGGSISIGVNNAGFDVDEVLMIADGADEMNSVHAKHNLTDIDFVPPSKWENKNYFDARKAENFDFMFAVPPCSGLSQINRNAKADSSTNDHFYRTFDMFNAMTPKVFAIENAPTLTSTGYPILKRMKDMLKDNYNMTVLSDKGGRHGVGMRRSRTMVVGWRRDHFDDKIPIIWDRGQPITTVRDIIGDLSVDVKGSNVPNHTPINDHYYHDKGPILRLTREKYKSFNRSIAFFHRDNPGEVERLWGPREAKEAARLLKHIEAETLLWDKSAQCLDWDGVAASMTSLSQWIHPTGDRMVTYREMARFMGYPDDFVFVDHGKCDKIQCMAQGVPAKFVEWIAKNCYDALKDDGRPRLADRRNGHCIVYQDNPHGTWMPLGDDDMERLTAMRMTKAIPNMKMPIENQYVME